LLTTAPKVPVTSAAPARVAKDAALSAPGACEKPFKASRTGTYLVKRAGMRLVKRAGMKLVKRAGVKRSARAA
jgi:hypothetical protein